MTLPVRILLSASLIVASSCKPRHFNNDAGTKNQALSSASGGGTAALLAAANSAIGKNKVTDAMCADIVTSLTMDLALRAAKQVCEGINSAINDQKKLPAHLHTAYGAAACKPNQCEVLFSPTVTGLDRTLTFGLKVENKSKVETVKTNSTTNSTTSTLTNGTEGTKVEGTQQFPSFDGSPPSTVDVNSNTDTSKNGITNGGTNGGTNGTTETVSSEVGQVLSLEYRSATVDGVFIAACASFGEIAGQLIDSCNERMALPTLAPHIKKLLEDNVKRNFGN